MYRDFMEESVLEAMSEMRAHFERIGEPYIESLEDACRENYYLRDHMQIPFIRDVLTKQENQDKLIDFTADFMESHNDVLSAPGPMASFTFGKSEVDFLYELFGITGEQILEMYNEMVQETWYGSISQFITGWIKHAPHKLLLVGVVAEAIQKNYSDVIEAVEYLLAFCDYPILFREFWKTGVREEVMIHTLEHLSSKFKVKKLGSLLALLKYDTTSSVEFKFEKLKTAPDFEWTDLLYSIRNRISNTLRNIANAYYEDIKEQNTTHTKSSTYEDGTTVDQEGYTTNLAEIVDNTIAKFSSGGMNDSIIKVVAEAAQVDKGNLTGYLNQIYAVKDNKMNRMIEDIITAYVTKNPTTTSLGNSTDFLTFGLSLYRSIGTSKDPLYHDIRSILDLWMFDIININQFYSRPQTIIAYTRAIYNYVVWMIYHYN